MSFEKIMTPKIGQGRLVERRVEIEKHEYKGILLENFCKLLEVMNVDRKDRGNWFCNIANCLFPEDRMYTGIMASDIKTVCKLISRETAMKLKLDAKSLACIFAKIGNYDTRDVAIDKGRGYTNFVDFVAKKLGDAAGLVQCGTSSLLINQVDKLFTELEEAKRNGERVRSFRRILKDCSKRDLKNLLLLIVGELPIHIEIRQVLNVVNPYAYPGYLKTKSIDFAVDTFIDLPYPTKPFTPLSLRTALSVGDVLTQFPNGMYCHLSRNRPRVHIHLFRPKYIRVYIQEEFMEISDFLLEKLFDIVRTSLTHVTEAILECEFTRYVIRSNNRMEEIGLGPPQQDWHEIHPNLFVVDCLYFYQDISMRPYKQRIEFLKKNFHEVYRGIRVAPMYEIKNIADLNKVIALATPKSDITALEFKDATAPYDHTGTQRLSLTQKYISRTRNSITLYLLVLGATIRKTEKRSEVIFLLGAYNREDRLYHAVVTVTRRGRFTFDHMTKTDEEEPKWLVCKSEMMPEYAVTFPEMSVVWKVTGMELVKDDRDGSISLLFPSFQGIEKMAPSNATAYDQVEHKFRRRAKEWRPSEEEAVRTIPNEIGMYSQRQLAGYEEQPFSSETCFPQNTRLAYSDLDPNLFDDKSEAYGYDIDLRHIKHDLLMEDSISDIIVPPPNIFSEVRLMVDPSCYEPYSIWLRRFVECGGTLDNDVVGWNATHWLHPHPTVAPNYTFGPCRLICRHARIEWIINSIYARKVMLNIDLYVTKCPQLLKMTRLLVRIANKDVAMY